MEFFPNYNTAINEDPGDWANAREAEGYQGVVASDHLWVGEKPFPHVWVTLTRMACATQALKLGSSFCNNLFRSPVEFAQASLALHQLAPGRFEAGLGAGWAAPEIAGVGLDYPAPKDRAGRYIEALAVVRQIFEAGRCRFSGNYYDIDVPVLGPFDGSAPLLVGSAGGARTRREITPIVDRIEVFAGSFIRAGVIDMAALARVSEAEVQALVGEVRHLRADLPIGYFSLVAAGESAAVDHLKAALGDGFAGGLVGHPEAVAGNLRRMGEWGIGRVQITELVPGTHTALAPYLFGGGT
jgi:alkanesulfonate monooxygenase SsuD/methylene tetrahydromethanopterin reductase-like flavin-dependent oxidoreductase (luciferase family)